MVDLAGRLDIEVEAFSGLTVAQVAEAKGLHVEFLKSLDLTDRKSGGKPFVAIPYLNTEGDERAQRRRYSLSGAKRFAWRQGDKPMLYGLWRLPDMRAAKNVLLVEGESDCWTLWQATMPALGVPGSSTWKPEWASYLAGLAVYVWREPDGGGDSLVRAVTSSIPEAKIVEAPEDAKDPSDLWLQVGCDAEEFRKRIVALITGAKPVCQLLAAEQQAEARGSYELAKPLLKDPRLPDRISETIQQAGYAGDTRPPMLAYLALTSRLLDRPMNLAFVAPSAAGKNAAVDAALALFPASAYHLEKAGSARALIYVDADFEHKTVIVAEADSIPEEGPAASAIRCLASENRMEYDVTERDPETGGFKTRHISKQGPTGLITTSTRPLGPQMNTRVLTVSINDTPEQTRAVLLAIAKQANGGKRHVDREPFIALQRWLELAGSHEVIVPFATTLAKSVPPEYIRARRDFSQLLTAIQTIALLNQERRQRDGDGRIVAEVEDYALARDILLEVFTTAASGGVSRAVREIVETVASFQVGTVATLVGSPGVTIKAAGDELGLATDTAWHRAQRAIRLGYLVNQETRKGHPAKLAIGLQLPEERSALPTVEELDLALHRERHSIVQSQADNAAERPDTTVELQTALL